MNDNILLKSTSKQLNVTVLDLFRNYHDTSLLSRSVWTETSLITNLLLDGDDKYLDSHGIAMRVTLDWALEKLQNGGDWEQDSYEILNIRFVQGKTRNAYMRIKGILNESTASAQQKSAIKRITNILIDELQYPKEIEQRKQQAIEKRYCLCSEEGQSILRSLAVLRIPVNLEDVNHLTLSPIKDFAHPLEKVNLVRLYDGATLIEVHPEIRSFLLAQMVEKRKELEELAAQMYEKQNNCIEAAYHWQQANNPGRAAEILIGKRRRFGKQELPIDSLKSLLGKFRRSDLDESQWAQIKLLAGRIAEITEDLTNAIIEFEQALETKDDLIRAEAYFWMGRTYRQPNTDRALDCYKQCRTLLAQNTCADAQQLLARTLASEAWIFFEQQKDFKRAEYYLKQAQQIVQGHEEEEQWFGILSDVYNSWGQFYAQQGRGDLVLEHCKSAWEYARNAPDSDIEQLTNTSHNSGIAHLYQEQYEEGKKELEHSLTLAQQSGNKRKEALNYKGLGNYYFWQKNFNAAIEHYLKAYDYYQKTSNRAWLASTCYDLTEAHLFAGNIFEARKFYAEGLEFAKPDNKKERESLNNFAEKHKELKADLKEAQLVGISIMWQKGMITNRQYCEATGVSSKTAYNHLNDLIEKGICKCTGQGRSTVYKLVSSTAH